jgi:hypothetical protein
MKSQHPFIQLQSAQSAVREAVALRHTTMNKNILFVGQDFFLPNSDK